MRNSIVLPVMGVLTIIAGAVGLQLGESAIAQIDPIHFQGPRPALRDVSRDARPQPGPTYASAAGWAEGPQVGDLDCGDCPALNARTAYAGYGADAVPDEPWRAPLTFDRADYEEQADTREWSEISRYVHYPVTQDQADLADSLAVDRAARAATEREPAEPAGL